MDGHLTVCMFQCLRSRASFLLLNTASGRLFVWHGVKSTDETRACALSCAQHLAKRYASLFFLAQQRCNIILFSLSRKPPELGVVADLSVQEVEEGSESSSFWKTLTSSRSFDSSRRSEVAKLRELYDCLLEGKYCCSSQAVFVTS